MSTKQIMHKLTLQAIESAIDEAVESGNFEWAGDLWVARRYVKLHLKLTKIERDWLNDVLAELVD